MSRPSPNIHSSKSCCSVCSTRMDRSATGNQAFLQSNDLGVCTMWFRPLRALATTLATLAMIPWAASANPAQPLPVQAFQTGRSMDAPVANFAFAPGPGASAAPEFTGVVKIKPVPMQTLPVLTQPVIQGRDARIFPGVELEFFTVGDVLVPVQRGEMVRETGAGSTQSYWRIIPQPGKVWHESQDGDWSRAAFPVMLVNDTENHAHQGLAMFLYRPGEVSGLQMQFIQQTGPYMIKQYFVAWGFAPADLGAANSAALEGRRAQA